MVNAPGLGVVVGMLLARCQCPGVEVLTVTLAETTPVLEAAGLQAELRRAGIEPRAWFINNSLSATHASRWCHGWRN